MHNFINVQLVNRLKFPTKKIQSTQVEGENFQIFKYLKITMHSSVHAIDMVDVDIVLGYPWMESIDIVNINVKNKFINLCCK
jgi:hypothetical protein